MSENQELPLGQYLVRIEDTAKKETKEKFDPEGNRLPANHYLQVALKVYGGPNDGQVEFVRLNLWNDSPYAVSMAKSERKSIEDVIGVVSTNSDHWHSKWLVLEVRAGKTEKSKDKLYKHYHPAPEGMVKEYAHIPPVPAKAPSVAARPAAQPAASLAGAPRPPATAAAAPASAADALPEWARKKA